ncbi:MAG: glycosyltransferase N-terminal domain-containing protein [Candidatus Cloacimonas sp.]|jgi:3-deoxy-D-manno-octulosonic-acid transferase|nr:glycosyltransferase N-terminal domain-containing protein [Candidatus Cloacimonas sp.]
MKALFTIYNAIIEAVYFLCYPFLLVLLKAKNYREAMQATGADTNKGILIHAASMGEVNAVKPLILRLVEAYPETRVCITTSTVTGLKLAKDISPQVFAYLSCLDVAHLRKKQLSAINPGLICIVETEIWPNMLAWAARNRVPVVFLNARMSLRSLGRYRYLKGLLVVLGSSIKAIMAQTNADAMRFEQIFSAPVISAGNLKFSLQLAEYDAQQLRSQWNFASADYILCWGSSRPGEEALLLGILPQLRAVIPKLKLIIAVRHLQRMPEVLTLLKETDYRLFSDLETDTQKQSTEILIIDEMGVLDKAYAISDLAIVGGSFYDFGGHNPLEPAFYSKPIIIGKYHHSCKESVKKLLDGQGIIVSDADILASDILKLSFKQARSKELGVNAKKVLSDNSAALDNHLEIIRKIWETR